MSTDINTEAQADYRRRYEMRRNTWIAAAIIGGFEIVAIVAAFLLVK